jgi:uncharacterized protein YjiS (DUF1127 family)
MRMRSDYWKLKTAFHRFWSLSMPTLTRHAARRGFRLHQENSGRATGTRWLGWLGLWARQQQRAVLRELADDPHRLNDLGLTRQQALEEADKPFWR